MCDLAIADTVLGFFVCLFICFTRFYIDRILHNGEILWGYTQLFNLLNSVCTPGSIEPEYSSSARMLQGYSVLNIRYSEFTYA